jgi:hypothetical protein
MRIGGGFWKNTRTPGTAAVLRRSWDTTSSEDSCRWSRGFRRMYSRPVLLVMVEKLGPTELESLSTFSSRRTISATRAWASSIPWNDTSSGPSTLP